MEKNQGKFLVRSYSIGQYFRELNLNSQLEDQPILMVTTCDFLETLYDRSSFTPAIIYCPDMTAEELRKQVEQHSQEHPNGRNTKILIETEDKFIDLMSIVHFTADRSRCRKSQLVRTNRFLMHERRWQTTEFFNESQRNFMAVTCEHR